MKEYNKPELIEVKVLINDICAESTLNGDDDSINEGDWSNGGLWK